MKARFQAGAEFDFLTEEEAARAARVGFTDAMVELRRGVKFPRRAKQATATAGGVLTITADDFGPDGGFGWAVTRVALNLAADEEAGIFVNDTTAGSFIGNIVNPRNFDTFDGCGLVLRPHERLIIAATGVTASGVYTATVSAVELPEPMLWQLLG